MKATVVGPGALGCLLAATLAWKGHPVTLLDYREDRASRLAERGLTVTSPEGEWTVRPKVSANAATAGHQEWIFVVVKANQTSSAVRGLVPLIGDGTKVLSLQNGMGHETALASVFRAEDIFLGVTSQGATLLGEGVVRHAGTGPTIFGPITPTEKTLRESERLAGLLTQTGWPASVTQEVPCHIWRKLIVNAGINALTALTGLPNGALLQCAETERIQALAVEEAWRVAMALKIRLGMSLDDVIGLVHSVCTQTAGNLSSMLQDRLHGRPTEIDFINGAIVSLGRTVDVETPVNETLTLLVRTLSRLGWTAQVPIAARQGQKP